MSEEKKTPKLYSLETYQLAKLQRAKEKLYAETHWYAVYVHPQHEFQIHDYLMGIEDQTRKVRRGRAKREDLDITIDPQKIRMQCYVPVIRTRVKYSDRYIWKEKVQTPGIIFVRTRLDQDHRDPLFHSDITEYVTGFLSDRTKHQPMPIPDEQMELFMALIRSEYAVSVDRPTFTTGDKMLIIEGSLAGYVAEVVAVRENVKTQQQESDRLGNKIFDADGNPVYKHTTILQFRLNSELAAVFEIDADKVTHAPDNAGNFDYQD